MNARIQKTIEQAATSWKQEFGDEILDGEWTGTAYADLSSADQQQIDWSDFHDAIRAVLEGPVVTCKVYMLTASETGCEDYTFRVFELPTGEAMVPGEITHDCWYESINAVEANGNAFVSEITDTGRKADFSTKEIKDSVAGSAGEFGDEAVPESLRGFLAGPLACAAGAPRTERIATMSRSIRIRDLGIITVILFATAIAGFFAGRDSRQPEVNALIRAANSAVDCNFEDAHAGRCVIPCDTDTDCYQKNGEGPFQGQEPGTVFDGRELTAHESLNGIFYVWDSKSQVWNQE